MTGHCHRISGLRLISAGLALLALSAAAQAQTSPSRPRIGIAFSGGGAKGIAHIGVLRVIEELRIPVDYVAGTSMGAIVGGLYASGMSPDELEAVILATDWADTLRDKPSRDQLVFRRKDDDVRFIPDLEVGVGKGGLRYPTGLRSGQKLGFLLRRFTLPVRSVADFDQLPIPFRAVATDIATGEMVVLAQGDLARAMRASMAIPSAFSAVELEGRLLVDGYLSNNVPVDVVRAMGADIVIAIDIGSPLTGAEEVRRSFLKIFGQTQGFLTRANMAPRLADADLVITPAVAGYGAFDMESGPEIEALGEAEARRMSDQIRRWAVSEEEYAAWKAQRQRRRPSGSLPVITAVRIEGESRVDRRLLDHEIRLQPGSPYDERTVRDDLARLYGRGDFETVDFELRNEEGGAVAVYSVRDKSWGPNYLKAGLSFAAGGEGENNLALLARLTATHLNARGAEWRTDLQLGSDALLSTELYQPWSFGGRWFVAPSAAVNRRVLPLFAGGERLAEVRVSTEVARLDLGYSLGRFGEVRLGTEWSWLDARRQSGDVPAEVEPFLDRTIPRAGIRLRTAVDRLDNGHFPKHGGLFHLDAYRGIEALGSEDEYTRIELRLSRFATRGRHTVFGGVQGGMSPGGVLPYYDAFRLGGLSGFASFEEGELAGDNYGLLRAGYYFRLTKMVYLGGALEAANVTTLPEDLLEDPLLSATGLLAAETPVGPFYLGFASGEGHRRFYLLFGRQF